MLRASTQINGEEVDITAVIKGGQVDSGVEAGGVLVAFAEAAMTGSESDVAAAREALRSRLGDAATVDAASVIANFERMVRIADGTGIPLDAPLAMITADMQEEIGTDQFPSAANTPKLNGVQATIGRVMARTLPLAFKVFRAVKR
ncbi:MAG: hypothetical protein H8E63_04830 [Proteobacteria bacterium]|nr:hypothetical protein [Pseudomonadota bacterium]